MDKTEKEPKVSGVQKANAEAADEAAKSPEQKAGAFEDTAPPGDEPGNAAFDTQDAATTFEQANIAKNQLRFERRQTMSSAEVNALEAKEAEKAGGKVI